MCFMEEKVIVILQFTPAFIFIDKVPTNDLYRMQLAVLLARGVSAVPGVLPVVKNPLLEPSNEDEGTTTSQISKIH